MTQCTLLTLLCTLTSDDKRYEAEPSTVFIQHCLTAFLSS